MTRPDREQPPIPEQERHQLLEHFLHPPAPTGIEMPPPGQTSRQLYAVLDAPDKEESAEYGKVSFLDKGHIVRMRYPVTAQRLDTIFYNAWRAHEEDLTNKEKKDAFRKAIGLTGGYNYIRGMHVLKKDDTVDREVAPKIMLSPSAALQVLEAANIQEDDRVLDSLCGTGYSTFTIGTMTPQRLDAVDNYTPAHYKLPETMMRAREMIYKDIPQDLQPKVTMPNFLDVDATALPKFGTEQANQQGFAEHYDKVFIHPPYGRESVKMRSNLSEGDAFILWVNSLRSLKEANRGKSTVFSVVPEEWQSTVRDIIEGTSAEDAIRKMYAKLREIKYYQLEDNAPKLSDPIDYEKAQEWKPDELMKIFENSSAKILDETKTGMFGLHLHKFAWE
ncbi:MAG: hypothetical protein ACR2LN_00285 [Candidatus Levyibacteriota bacterium]